MDAREKRYNKIAKAKAKEYLKDKKGYRTKAEKKAFKIAERFRIKEWKKSLFALDEPELALQMKAYKTYRSRINLNRNLIFTGVSLFLVVVMLVVFL